VNIVILKTSNNCNIPAGLSNTIKHKLFVWSLTVFALKRFPWSTLQTKERADHIFS